MNHCKETLNLIKISVRAEVAIPNGVATEAEITEWLRFHLLQDTAISSNNRLSGLELSSAVQRMEWDTVRAISVDVRR